MLYNDIKPGSVVAVVLEIWALKFLLAIFR